MLPILRQLAAGALVEALRPRERELEEHYILPRLYPSLNFEPEVVTVASLHDLKKIRSFEVSKSSGFGVLHCAVLPYFGRLVSGAFVEAASGRELRVH